MNLVRFEPWSIVDLMQRDFDRVSNRQRRRPDGNSAATDWRPAVDIVEEKDRFVLHADVPGVDPKDIEVSMDDGLLIMSGERRTVNRDDFDGLQRLERAVGRFSRRFTLPESVDADGISARCRDGILRIEIPKSPEVQARRITVEAA